MANQIDHLQERLEKLTAICLSFEPGQEVPAEIYPLLEEFDLEGEMESENPFALSNKLLMLLDETQREIQDKETPLQ